MKCRRSFLGLRDHRWDHIRYARVSYDGPDAVFPIEGVSRCLRCGEPYVNPPKPPEPIKKDEHGLSWVLDGDQWVQW